MHAPCCAALVLALTVPLSAQREAVATGPSTELCGRVLDVETREPLAGVPVELTDGLEELLVVHTDADGRYRIPLPAGDRSSLRIEALDVAGWRSCRRCHLLPGTVARHDLLLRRTETAPLVGRAVDRETGEPLAGLVFKLYEHGGPNEVVRCDDEGRFTTATQFAAARMQAVPKENPELSPEPFDFEHRLSTAEPGEHTLWFARTVELALQFTPPPGGALEDFHVVVLEAGHPPTWTGLRGATLLAGGPVRVRRFEQRGWRPRRPRFHLLARDGYARAEVTAQPEGALPQRIELQPCGALQLEFRQSVPLPDRVETIEGRTVSFPHRVKFSGLDLELTHLGTGERIQGRSPIGKEATPLSYLTPGRWRVDATSPHYPPLSAEVEVVAGVTVPLDFVLEPALSTGRLMVVVAEEVGEVPAWEAWYDAPPVRGLARSLEDPKRTYAFGPSEGCGGGPEFRIRCVERGGRHVLVADLHDILLGEYEILVRAGKRLLVASKVIASVGETATFVLRAEEPR